MRVDPEGPDGVVEIENEYFWEGEAVGEGLGDELGGEGGGGYGLDLGFLWHVRESRDEKEEEEERGEYGKRE